MSYLNIPSFSGADFSKAVISLWFRVPQTSIDAAQNADSTRLNSVIPLVTFGMPQVDTVQGPVDPCYIGIACSSPGPPSLVFNLQTAQYADIFGYRYAPGPTYSGGYITTVIALHGDRTQPEFYFVNSPATITPGKWHHLLWSFALSAEQTTGAPYAPNGVTTNAWLTEDQGVISYSRMWYALDDINQDGPYDLEPISVDGAAGSAIPNAVTTLSGVDVAGSTTGVESVYIGLPQGWIPSGYVPATYSFSDPTIPANGGPFGIPASATFVDNVFNVEMAEFQMFTGVSLDTGVVANRRLFIDGNGRPVNPKAAIAGLKQPPNVAFVNSSRAWMLGFNSGITRGSVKRTGRIIPYFPNPKLGV